MKDMTEIAHEIWASAVLLPGEGIEDGAARVEAVLRREFGHQGLGAQEADITKHLMEYVMDIADKHKVMIKSVEVDWDVIVGKGYVPTGMCVETKYYGG